MTLIQRKSEAPPPGSALVKFRMKTNAQMGSEVGVMLVMSGFIFTVNGGRLKRGGLNSFD